MANKRNSELGRHSTGQYYLKCLLDEGPIQMKFGGFQKISFIDFPAKMSSVLFTTGCNLRCPFCHNWRLIMDPKEPFLSEEDAIEILDSRKKYVDAVVVTGGEPCLNNDLPDFFKRLKDRDFSVKLDTNGFYPQTLQRSLSYVEYVAIDVKTSLSKYRTLGAEDTQNLVQSVNTMKEVEVEYEFRNTVVPGIVDEDDVVQIGELVSGATRFVFQQFVSGDTLDKNMSGLKPYSSETISHFAEIMKNYVDEVLLRI